MRRIHLSGAVLASALALAACGQAQQNAASANATNAAAPAAQQAASSGDNVANEGASAEAGAQQDFTIVNNSGHTVMTLNVSASDSDQWGPDILGTDTLANGESGSISFARGQDQCQWDIRATFDDGTTGDWRNNNLCELSTITLTPE